MKKLHWKRVLHDPDSETQTIWKKLDEYKVDMNEIENLFSQKTSKKVLETIPSEVSETSNSTVAVKRIFEPKTQCAIEVGMRSLPKLEVIKLALMKDD